MSFHKFPLLPLEIQHHVWSIAVGDIQPRTIFVHVKHSHSKEPPPWFLWSQPNLESFYIHLTPVTAIPAVLHACRESRSQASTRYSRALALEPHRRYIWADVYTDQVSIVEDDYQSKFDTGSVIIFRTAALYTRQDDALRSFESVAVDNVPNLDRIRIPFTSSGATSSDLA